MTQTHPARPDAILFDWDNTLVDSWGTIQTALNLTFTDFGRDIWDMAETKSRVARSLRDSFPELFGDRWELARDRFYAHFNAIHLESLTPLPAAFELLSALKESGIYLGVVSNKNGDFLRAEISHLEWDHFFGGIVGATDAANDKPAVDPVHLALGGSVALPHPNMWFVGDSVVDIQCARNVGATAILIGEDLTGHGETSVSALLTPDWHFRDCEALVGVVKSFRKAL
ncbi:HAD family hydrolase [Thalassospira sp.]|uniref:HAD family hydrolase n=1 Tax=Thalassospira sp. TaxID=1912094 RepID=UPI002732F808|nr:HAD family hydrolase [Thalassospira sp.]MDP2697892.1 HAD family hydrolase [Thalassospira sp.]